MADDNNMWSGEAFVEKSAVHSPVIMDQYIGIRIVFLPIECQNIAQRVATRVDVKNEKDES